MLEIFKKLFKTSEEEEEESDYPDNCKFGNGYIVFDLKFEDNMQVSEMINECLVIKHNHSLLLEAKKEQKKVLIRINYAGEVNKALIDEMVDAIMSSYREIINNGEDN